MKKCLALLFVLTIFSACQQKGSDKTECFFKGEDCYQRNIVLQDEPKRIISFSSAVTEITFLLGAEEKLIGISDFCDYPPETAKITKVGKLININVESLLALHPDLVIISSVVSKEDVGKIERAGIPVFSVKAENHISDLFSTIQILGKILNRENEAARLETEYRQKLKSFHNADSAGRKSVYYVVGFGKTGDFTAPGNSYIQDIIAMAGGRNIGEPLHSWNVSREYLFEQDPDLIFIREEDKESFCNTAPYDQLTAVRKGNVYAIPSGWIDVLSPRNILAIERIHQYVSDVENN